MTMTMIHIELTETVECPCCEGQGYLEREVGDEVVFDGDCEDCNSKDRDNVAVGRMPESAQQFVERVAKLLELELPLGTIRAIAVGLHYVEVMADDVEPDCRKLIVYEMLGENETASFYINDAQSRKYQRPETSAIATKCRRREELVR